MYEITYEGDIKFDNQSGESTGGKKDQLPPLESDINAIFTIGEGSIIAQQDDLSQVSLAFSDMAIAAYSSRQSAQHQYHNRSPRWKDP